MEEGGDAEAFLNARTRIQNNWVVFNRHPFKILEDKYPEKHEKIEIGLWNREVPRIGGQDKDNSVVHEELMKTKT